jgi:phosphopantetheinyl transferase (holo-ACP synthase)
MLKKSLSKNEASLKEKIMAKREQMEVKDKTSKFLNSFTFGRIVAKEIGLKVLKETIKTTA